MTVTVGERLSLSDVVAVARGEPAALSPEARARMQAARDVVDRKVAAGETVYGVTTGLGSLANVRLSPDEGSLGASGDLAPLAHLALPLIGEGQASWQGVHMTGALALEGAGLEPLALEPKEGLSLINGTQGMLAVGLLALSRGRALAKA